MSYPVHLKWHQTDFVGVSPNLDDMDAPGLFEYVASSVTYYLLVIKDRAGDIMQVRIRGTDGAATTRKRASGTWGAWVATVDGSNLVLTDVPTADPEVDGQVWANSNVLTLGVAV